MNAPSGQSNRSVEKNVEFFRDRMDDYKSGVDTLDTYQHIRRSVNEELKGIRRLIDIGNGGTFDYDVSLPGQLVAVDLFLEELAEGTLPPSVIAKNGNALDLPFEDGTFDGAMMAMVIHHLVGSSVEESLANASRAVGEAFRMISPGGKLVIVESCVPPWFYAFEKIVFPLAIKVIGKLLVHPATIQFTPSIIAGLVREYASNVEVTQIPRGRWILQYGFKYPAALTPAAPYRFVAHKT